MKKMKKIFAVLLTLAMVLGMNATVFAAATDKATVTIKGLAENDATSITGYQFISFNATDFSWTVATWAEQYVNRVAATADTPAHYEVTDAEGLKNAAMTNGTAAFTATDVNTVEKTFSDIAIGAYVINASSPNTTYSAMVANTYKDITDGEITAEDATVIAKASEYKVDKTATEKFVGRGDTVHFTIKTTFPSYDAESMTGDVTYKIVDTPTGLDINTDTDKVTVQVGTAPLTRDTDYTVTKAQNGEVTIEFTGGYKITSDDTHAGEAVEITYEAVVTADNGYENTANSFAGDTQINKVPDEPDPNPGEEKGYTGSITVSKVDSETNAALTGATFQVTKTGENTPMLFVPVEGQTGVYKPALVVNAEATEVSEKYEDGASADITVSAVEGEAKGTVKIQGLAAGTYHFTETVAPQGYAVADNADQTSMNDVTITANENADVNVDNATYLNTQLASLPSTGGIGTTIFTIGGCAIMIIAAGLYFATRRKITK